MERRAENNVSDTEIRSMMIAVKRCCVSLHSLTCMYDAYGLSSGNILFSALSLFKSELINLRSLLDEVIDFVD